MGYILLFIAVLLGSVAQVPLKYSSQHYAHKGFSFFINKYTIIGYSIMLVASALSFIGIRSIELKNVPIIESIGYVIILGIGKFVFREKIGFLSIIGSLMIIGGIIVFNL